MCHVTEMAALRIGHTTSLTLFLNTRAYLPAAQPRDDFLESTISENLFMMSKQRSVKVAFLGPLATVKCILFIFLI